MPSLLPFDSREAASLAQLGSLREYGKLGGYLHAADLGLSVAPRGAVLTAPDETIVDQIGAYGPRIMCRPDAPRGQGNSLPRGRDLTPDEAPAFLGAIQQKQPEAVLLLFATPSVDTVGVQLERYETAGAANVAVQPGVQIVVEFVGPGFDAGDVTRGRTAHWTAIIDWDDRLESPRRLAAGNQKVLKSYFEATPEQYTDSRTRRLEDLVVLAGESVRVAADQALPRSGPTLNSESLGAIYSSGLTDLMLRLEDHQARRAFGREALVMMNLYASRAYVFEVWSAARFLKNSARIDEGKGGTQ